MKLVAWPKVPVYWWRTSPVVCLSDMTGVSVILVPLIRLGSLSGRFVFDMTVLMFVLIVAWMVLVQPRAVITVPTVISFMLFVTLPVPVTLPPSVWRPVV